MALSTSTTLSGVSSPSLICILLDASGGGSLEVAGTLVPGAIETLLDTGWYRILAPLDDDYSINVTGTVSYEVSVIDVS